MFKKILLIAAMVFPMLAAAQNVKIGLVDTNAVLSAMPETTAAQTKLQDTSKKYDDDYQKLGQEMQRLYEELQKMDEKELPAIRDRKVREFQDYQTKLQQFEQAAAQDLQKLQEQLMSPIIAKVRSAIEAVGKEGNFTIVYDNNPQLILYHGTGAEDITPLVKAKLNLK